MPRSLTVLLVPLALLAVAPAAPVPKGTTRPLYFPTAVGSVWVYDLGGQDDVRFVSAVRARDGVDVVEVSHKPTVVMPPVVCEVVEVSAKGVFRTEDSGTTYDPPFTLLRLPLDPGQVWAGAADPHGGPLRSTATARGEEWVEVPAGRYKAARVDWVTTDGAQRNTCTVWYAPGVGVVKSTTNVNDFKMVLKSFTPGNR